MEKKIVELSDEALDGVSGGLVINDQTVTNMETGEVFPLLRGTRYEVFAYVCSLNCSSESEKIEALRSAGYVA